jgi:hypothetical protein
MLKVVGSNPLRKKRVEQMTRMPQVRRLNDPVAELRFSLDQESPLKTRTFQGFFSLQRKQGNRRNVHTWQHLFTRIRAMVYISKL